MRNANTDNEVGSFIGSFVINGKRYCHYIFTTTDDRVELQDEDGKTILIYDSHCTLSLPNGHVLGRFRTGTCSGVWDYVSEDPVILNMAYSEIHPENLLHFELMISEEYIKKTLGIKIDRFQQTVNGYREAVKWLRDNDLYGKIEHEQSTDGYTVVALANKLFKDKEK